MNVKHLVASLLALSLLLSFVACSGSPSTAPVTTTEAATEPPPTDALLNGASLTEYTIVYSDTEPDYNLRAAEYIQTAVEARTGIRMEIVEDDTPEAAREIVVGETNRAISTSLEAETQNMEFAFLAADGKVAMEGDYFIIAAAAYYFVATYVPSALFRTAVPETVTVCEPIVEEAKNFIFLIGDGMGEYQTKLFDVMDAPTEGDNAFGDGEDIFYGYYFPYQGLSQTNSLSGVTDSAAGGTALATGYKTTNGRVGQRSSGMPADSLTEIAAWSNKATAIMSTEPSTGATPASFSAHVSDRSASNGIELQQKIMASDYGTIFRCDYNVYTVAEMPTLEAAITETLDALSQNENGFFLMYEEAYIDKHCHNNDIHNTLLAMMRFNQAIGLFMEYAFYHPDTFVLITADHETGNLKPNADGVYTYNSPDHSGANVPVFVYGKGAEIFDGKTMSNTVIPKTIAMKFWGEKSFGDAMYTPLS